MGKTSWTRVLLVLGFLCLLPAFAAGQLNCNTAGCVEIPYSAGGDGYNTHCRVLQGDGGHNYAFSAQYAEGNMYGQNAVGGSVDTSGQQTNGYRRECNATSDCTQDIGPVSGTVSSWISKAASYSFWTDCTEE